MLLLTRRFFPEIDNLFFSSVALGKKLFLASRQPSRRRHIAHYSQNHSATHAQLLNHLHLLPPMIFASL